MQNTDNPLTPTYVPHTKPLSKSSPILILASRVHLHSCLSLVYGQTVITEKRKGDMDNNPFFHL